MITQSMINYASAIKAYADVLQAQLDKFEEQQEREERKRQRRPQGPFNGMPPWAFGGLNPFSGFDGTNPYGDLVNEDATDEELLRGGTLRFS
jgi:hypothetical protein